jgi:hypothetical protein
MAVIYHNRNMKAARLVAATVVRDSGLRVSNITRPL